MPPPRLPPAYYQNWESPFSFAPPPTPLPFGMSQSDLQGMGFAGAAMQTVTPFVSEWARKEFGAFGFTFGSGINPATTEYSRNFLQQLNAGRQAGATADQAALSDLLRGMAAIVGHQPDMAATRAAGDGRLRFDAGIERAMSRLASDGGAMLPFLAAMMPDALDSALPGGSRTVAAASMTAANRFMVDPVTGRRLSEDAQFSTRILDDIIARGPAATDGLRAGRVGQTYAELARRGLIGPGESLQGDIGTRDAFEGGLGGAAGLGAPGMSRDQAQRVSGDRIRRTLEGYSKTVAAINEIFAENGRANAPMAELIQGLEAMTQGGLSTYAPEQLTRIARQFQGAGQEFGLTQAAMTAMGGQAGAQLAAVGGHRGLSAPAALFAAAAGNAYGSRGFLVGPETGGMNDQIAMAMARTTQFAGSEMANLMGALEVQSRYLGAGGENTDLGRVVGAFRAGQTTATLNDGSTFDFATATQGQIVGLAERSGLSSQSVLNQIAFGQGQNRAAAVSLQNQPGFDAARQTVQRQMSERFFLNQFGGNLETALGGRATTRQFMDAVYAAAADPTVTSLDQAVSRAGGQFGLSQRQMAEIGPTLDAMGREWALSAGVTDVSGLAGIRNMSPQAQAGAAGSMGRMNEAADRAAALARLNPQGALASGADAVARAGRLAEAGGFYRPDGGLDWQRMGALGLLGGVDGEAAARALGQRGPGFGGGVIPNTPAGGGLRPAQANPNGIGGGVRVNGEIVIIDNGVRRPAAANLMMGDQPVPGGGP